MTHEVLETDNTSSSVETTPERKKPFHPSYKTMLAEQKKATRTWKIQSIFWAAIAGLGWGLLILEKI